MHVFEIVSLPDSLVNIIVCMNANIINALTTIFTLSHSWRRNNCLSAKLRAKMHLIGIRSSCVAPQSSMPWPTHMASRRVISYTRLVGLISFKDSADLS